MTLRQLAATAVVGVWVAVLGVHVRREYFGPPELALIAGARALAPGTNYFVIRMNGSAIGVASARLDTTAEGFLFEDNTTLSVPAMGRSHAARTLTRIRMSEALRMQSFQFELASEIGNFAVTGTTAGDSTMNLVIAAGGDVQRTSVALDPDVLLDAAASMRLAAAGELQVGREFSMTVFDPSSLSDRRVTMRVTATDTLELPDSAAYDAATATWAVSSTDTIPVWRLEQEFGGVVIGTWVDEDGATVRAESPVGFTIERTAYELARQEFARSSSDPQLAAGYGTIIESTAIASSTELVPSDNGNRLAVQLRNVDLTGFDLEGGRQQLRGDTLIVTRETAEQFTASYALPYAGDGEPAAELGGSALIQVDDPRIRERARAIVGSTTDPAEAARRLNEWVYENLRKEITVSVPSAVQVLEAGRGDCNEHTVLYVALARAIGLPTRTAVGLVQIQGQFYYHAWPEVWLDEWVAVDPTLGQLPADATHLRFLIGGLARQVELIRLIGRLQLEVV